MKHALLCLIPLLLLATDVPAQQSPATAASASPAANSATDSTPKMTPRQMAELRGDLLMARKEYGDAVKMYEQALGDNRDDAQVLNKIGVAYQEMIELRHAEQYYKKAIKADKTFVSAVNNIGTVEYEKKHYSKAIKYYLKALKLRSDMATLYTNLGYAYVERKQYPEAVSAFRQALGIDPTVFDRKGEGGAIVQQRTTTDPGLFYFFVAKSYALAGDAEHAAHFLKLARDDGYKNFSSAKTDPAFAKVIADPRVQEVLTVVPSYATVPHKT
jgi:tetratricopeptide (TPR) repeat protein